MATDPWAEFEEVAPATPAGIYTIPDPIGEQERAREARTEARQERTEQRQIDDTGFSRASSLRTEFLGLPDVKQFNEVRNSTQQILALTEGEGSAMGDLGLVFSYMKALDPGSVVREGEFATAQNAAGVPGKIRNLYNQLASGERLNPEQRRDMADTALTIFESRVKGYNDLAETYRGLLRAEGVEDPDLHGVRLFDIESMRPQAEGEARDVEMFGGLPVGTEIQWDIDAPETAFDRAAYLQRQYGITPDQEALITGFWNAQRGNQALTVDAVKQWYQGQGIPLPTDEGIAQAIEGAKAGHAFGSLDTSAAEQAYLRQLDEALATRGADPESMSGTVGAKAAQGLLWGGLDEAAGVGGFAGELIRGGNPVAGYQAERDLIRREQERAAAANPGTAIASELIGGMASGGAGFRNVRTLGDAARAGATTGAIAGFNYGEGAGGSLGGAAVGAGLGAAAGAGGHRVQEALRARSAARSATPGREVIEAADRVNAETRAQIRPIPADVAGPTVRRATGGAAQTTFGAAPVIRAAKEVEGQAGQAVRTLAEREGQVLSRQGAGERAVAGADKTIKRTKAKVDALYTKARKLAGGQRVELPNARAQLEQEIAELADTPGGASGVEYFRSLVGRIEGDWPVDGVKRFRRELRDKLVKDGLRGSEMETRALRIADAADFDIEQGLVNAGKAEAAKAYQQASKAASERYTLIDDVLQPVLGRKGEKSGEQAFGAIERLSRGDAVTLGKFMKALPKEEAGAIRASLIARLGRATKGQQDSTGEAFSLGKFLTDWNDEGISPEAKGALFGGELRSALDDLARVAQGTKEAQRYANFSNTAGANLFNALLTGGPLGVAAFDVPTAAGVMAGSVTLQALVGKALASPGFARWLARMPKQKTPEAVKAHIGRLERIAANDTVIATEALGLQRQLSAMFEGGAQRLAAEDADPAARTADSRETAGAAR